MKKMIAWFGAAVLAATLVVACGGKSKNDSTLPEGDGTGTTEPTTTDAYGGGDVYGGGDDTGGEGY